MNTHINGIDYLRALMSVCVVIWHMHGFGTSAIFDASNHQIHTFGLSDVLNFHFLLLAVPVFIFISCYLFAESKPEFSKLKTRIKRLTLLVVFWPIAYLIWKRSFAGMINYIPRSLDELIIFIFTAGNTIYYFLIVLIILLSITYAAAKLPVFWNWVLLAASLIFIFFLPVITINTESVLLSAYWNPLNFLPYPFAAVLISNFSKNLIYNSKNLFIAASVLFILGIFSAVYEWQNYNHPIYFEGSGFALPAFARVSIVFFAMALLILSLNPKIPENRIIKFMSKNSLALYCLHPFFTFIAWYINGVPVPDWSLNLLKVSAVVIVCYSMTYIFARFFRKEVIVSHKIQKIDHAAGM
jgi:peptidoglycan/LPS O-acetylase OafA/YrhL